jgi:PAS domain S-box-containing protein
MEERGFVHKNAHIYSEEVFRSIIEYGTYATVLLLPDGNVVYANPFTQQVLGYTTEEFESMNTLYLIHPSDLLALKPSFATLLEHPGDFIPFILRVQHKNGTWCWIEGTIRNCLHTSAIRALIVTFQDVTVKKQTEEHLKQSEERYRIIFEQASDGIYVADQQGNYLDVNAAACAMVGYTREELLSKNVWDLAPDKDYDAIAPAVRQLMIAGITRTRWQFKRKDGTLIPIELHANPLSNGDLMGVVRDISLTEQIETEQVLARHHVEELVTELQAEREASRHTEQKAAQHAQQLSAIFEAMTDGIVVVDKDGHVLQVNAATRSFIGQNLDQEATIFSLKPILPDPILPHSTVDGKLLPLAEWPIVRVLHGERLYGKKADDVIAYNQEGKPFFFNVSGAPVFDNTGEIVGGVIVLRDVTKRRHLEQKLGYSELKLRSLVDANVVGVAVVEIAGRILEVNDQLTSMLRYNKDELLAPTFHWKTLTPPGLRTLEAQAIKMLVATGSIPPRERHYLRKDGSQFPALVTATMIDQERKLALVLILDISDRQAAEQRKQEFLSMVSHELRTPLTGIVGFLDLALFSIRQLAQTASPEQEESIKQLQWLLQQADQHASVETRMVEALLDVALMEQHTFKLSLKICDLAETVRDVVLAQIQISEKMHIMLQVSPRMQVPVMMDEDRIKQVIINYLTNALKYTEDDREIIVGMEVTETVVRVYVHDQGPGLTVEQQQEVWERFYQTDPSTKKGGLGLGLYIAKILITQHHGQVGVESQPGEGSTFWFTLPLHLAPSV